MSNVQDTTQSAMPNPNRLQASNLIAPITDPPPLTSFSSQHLPNMTQLMTNHPWSAINYTYALPVPPHITSQSMDMNMRHSTMNPICPMNIHHTPKMDHKRTPRKLKNKIIPSSRYLITNVHHPLMSTNDPSISTCHSPMKSTYPNTAPPHPSSPSHRSSPNHVPASAPHLFQVDPVAAALSSPKGPPPEYATIDPRKLRNRRLRPIFFRKGDKEKVSRYLNKYFYQTVLVFCTKIEKISLYI